MRLIVFRLVVRHSSILRVQPSELGVLLKDLRSGQGSIQQMEGRVEEERSFDAAKTGWGLSISSGMGGMWQPSTSCSGWVAIERAGDGNGRRKRGEGATGFDISMLPTK